MKRRAIFDGYVQDDPPIRERFVHGPFGWQGADAARRQSPAPPWSDADLAELREFNRRNAASQATLDNIERLADPAARVIIAGQQPGLALGPLYTLYKALGAIRLARQAHDELGVPVIPCFWVASEDHDFEEIREVNWLGREGELASFRYEPASAAEGLVARAVRVEPSLGDLIRRLEETTADSEFKPWVMEWLRGAMDGADNLESFFTRCLHGLLGEYGIVAVSPFLMGLRRQAARLFEREINDPGASTRAILEAGGALADAGYAPGLHRSADDINFFLLREERRCKLSWDGRRIAIDDPRDGRSESDPAALAAQVRESPARISTNVVSRPIVQDTALPTIGCVAGPGEIAYFAQLREVYALWEAPMPPITPRPRVLLADSRVSRFLEKSDTTLGEFLDNDPKSLMRLVAMRTGSHKALAALVDAQQSLEEEAEHLASALGNISPSVAKAVEKLRESQAKAIETVERRLEQELLQRNTSQMRRLERVEQWLRPGGRPQERVYSALAPLLVNHGPEVIAALAGKIDPRQTDLHVVDL